ncbi:hypothetical protein Hypma_013116 [Hypsizygus marmoreus]|uniref:Uncharacterized protein n=1 Tax=Hypsizygus marmoreus TaxID=39966 RepID=A0A369JD41_HYPMA|nr:hypothetical protein Hypma_013116 [Hypsizygus marmoreus]
MKFIHVICALLFASGCSAVPLEVREDRTLITAENAEVGMVLMVRLKRLEERCKKKISDLTRTHPMLVISAKDGVVKVCPISKDNPLTPNVDIGSVASGLGATGQIFVGPPCSFTVGKGVNEWKNAKRATSTEIEAVRKAIQNAENAENAASVPQATATATAKGRIRSSVPRAKAKGKTRSKL